MTYEFGWSRRQGEREAQKCSVYTEREGGRLLGQLVTLRIKARADWSVNGMNGFDLRNVWNEELAGIAVIVWFRGEGEIKDRFPGFRLEQLNEMVLFTLLGKSKRETGHLEGVSRVLF